MIRKMMFMIAVLALPSVLACDSKHNAAFTEESWQKSVAATDPKSFYAPNRTEGRFHAPWMKMPDRSFLEVLGWKLFSKADYTPEEEAYLPEVIPGAADRMSRTRGDAILWIGHNTFLVRVGGEYWLTDPIFTKRALLPARVTPPAITLAELNRLTTAPNILISHNHYDHLDRPSMEGLPGASRVFTPLGLGDYVKKMDKPHTREMDWWEEADLGGGVRLIFLPTQHWSMRITQGRNKSLWGAWLLITPDHTLYFGGDSGYFKGFAETGKRFPGIDYAFMATTAYHPRWFMHYQHMNIPEAIQGFEELGARYFIPTQWGTFHLGSEPPGYPGLDLERHIQERHLDPSRFKIMDIGEILAIR